MDFLTLAKARYSVRAYRPDPIPDGLLAQVLEAARLAPTACNRQPFQILVIRTEGRRAELARICRAKWFVEAPLLVCACGLPADSWVRADGKNYNDVDVAIAMDHLILAATDLGLGTCWVAAFHEDAAREVLGLPPGVVPVAFTPLGYAADEAPAKAREPISKLVRSDHW